MTLSRRELSLLLPALAAAQSGKPPALASRVCHANQTPYLPDPDQPDRKKGRRFLFGKTHDGFAIEMHETVLSPGATTHAPHQHPHDEIVLLTEGTLEAHLEGKTETVEAGSVIYLAGNQRHSVRNAGATPARYYAIELRGEDL